MPKLTAALLALATLVSFQLLAPAGHASQVMLLEEHEFARSSYPHPPHTHSTQPRTGGISYLMSNLRVIQRAVDRGDRRYLYRLDPVQVTSRDLPHFGFTGAPITLVSPSRPRPAPTAHTGEDGFPETDVIVRYRSRQYWIVPNQFVRHGPRGIWSIITITPM